MWGAVALSPNSSSLAASNFGLAQELFGLSKMRPRGHYKKLCKGHWVVMMPPPKGTPWTFQEGLVDTTAKEDLIEKAGDTSDGESADERWHRSRAGCSATRFPNITRLWNLAGGRGVPVWHSL